MRRPNAPSNPFVNPDRRIDRGWLQWLMDAQDIMGSTEYVAASAAIIGTNISGTVASSAISLSVAAALPVSSSTRFVQATANFAGTNASGTIASSGISVSVANQTSNLPARLSYTQNMPLSEAGVMRIGVIDSTGTSAASAAANPFGSSFSLQRIFLPAPMALTEVDLAFGISFPATNQGQGSLSQSVVVYSFGNSTSLNSVLSASRSASWASGTTTSGTSSSLQQGWSGPNVQPMTFAATSLSAGEYAVGHLFSWAAESTSWTISVYGGVAPRSTTAGNVTNIVAATAGVAGTFATASSALTAFTGPPATAPVFLTATGTSVALAGVSAFSGSTSTAVTAFTGPVSAPVFATANAANPALLAVSAHTGSTSTAVTVFNATPTSAGVQTSAGYSAGSFHASTTSSALTMWNAAPSAFNLSGVGSTAALSTTNVSTFTAGARVINATATVASVVSFLLNTGTAAFAGLSTAGLVAFSARTASTSAGVLSNSGTAAAPVLLSGGFAAGSFMTVSSIAAVLSNAGTAGVNLLSSAGFLAGSFMTASGSAAAITGATGAASLAASFTTASQQVVTAVATATAAGNAVSTVNPSFGYNGSIAMTTDSSQAIYQSGCFIAGMMATGARPTSIDLRSTAVTVTGSLALQQPWFAFCGS